MRSAWVPRVLLLLLPLTVHCRLPSLDDETDRRGWMDPADMGMPSHVPKAPVKKIVEGAPSISDCREAASSLKACQDKLSDLEQTSVTRNDSSVRTCPRNDSAAAATGSERLFLTRHVRFLLNKFGLSEQGEASFPRRFRSTISFSKSDMDTLDAFSKGDSGVKPTDIDQVLSSMFEKVERFSSYTDSPPRDYSTLIRDVLPSTQDVFWILLISVFCLIIALFWTGTPFWKILSLLFLLSSGWHWTHLYKKALSLKHSTLAKSSQIPAECSPDNMGWFKFVTSSFSTKDKCAAYHEALLVDPLWEVSPTMALAETFTQFVLLPLEHLGRHIGKFFGALLGELSWMSSPMILLFVFVAILLTIVMVFGYRFRLPFFLGSFEPRSPSPSKTGLEASRYVQSLQEEIRMLEITVDRQRRLRLTEETHQFKTVTYNGDGNSRVQQCDAADLAEICLARELEKENPGAQKCLDEENSARQRDPATLTILEQTDTRVQAVVAKVNDERAEEDTEDFVNLTTNDWKDLLKKSPRKRLVARGTLSSPGETDFEWQEEEGEGEQDDDGNSEVVKDADSTLSNQAFLDTIQSMLDRKDD